jgi:hypothetical protein
MTALLLLLGEAKKHLQSLPAAAVAMRSFATDQPWGYCP